MTISSVAILPFVDLSPEKDQRYFCDGLAAELITALSRVQGLRVAPRGSSVRFRNVEDAPQAGRQLGPRFGGSKAATGRWKSRSA